MKPMYVIPIAMLVIAAIVFGVWQMRISRLRKSFNEVQRSWQKELESNGIIESAKWTSARPFLTTVDGMTFMLKEVNFRIPTTVLVVDGQTSSGHAEGTGYSVAIQQSNGQWKPTGMLLNVYRNRDAVSELSKLIRANGEE